MRRYSNCIYAFVYFCFLYNVDAVFYCFIHNLSTIYPQKCIFDTWMRCFWIKNTFAFVKITKRKFCAYYDDGCVDFAFIRYILYEFAANAIFGDLGIGRVVVGEMRSSVTQGRENKKFAANALDDRCRIETGR